MRGLAAGDLLVKVPCMRGGRFGLELGGCRGGRGDIH